MGIKARNKGARTKGFSLYSSDGVMEYDSIAPSHSLSLSPSRFVLEVEELQPWRILGQLLLSNEFYWRSLFKITYIYSEQSSSEEEGKALL